MCIRDSFSIAFSDDANNAGTAVTAVTDGSSVTIDNTHPTASAAVLAVAGTGNGNNGDSMTLTITPSETIGTPTCVFKSGGAAMANTVAYSTSGGDHICTIAVADADTDGSVTFTLDFSDSAGNAATQVTSASAGSVTIDNTHPTLSDIAMSTNGNTGYAKSGNTITLAITASESVTSLACTIDGETATMGGS